MSRFLQAGSHGRVSSQQCHYEKLACLTPFYTTQPHSELENASAVTRTLKDAGLITLPPRTVTSSPLSLLEHTLWEVLPSVTSGDSCQTPYLEGEMLFKIKLTKS